MNMKKKYIKMNLLKSSKFIFNISNKVNKNPQINDIECIYNNNKHISFDEILKLYAEKNDFENESELSINYDLFFNTLNIYKSIIEKKISIFKFDYNFKIIIELTNTITKNNNIYSLNAAYSVIEHPFLTTILNSSDNDILGKKESELEGFNSLIYKLNLQTITDQLSFNETTKVTSKIDEKKRVKILETFLIDNNEKDNESIFVLRKYKIIMKN